jgi:hypothetical protein
MEAARALAESAASAASAAAARERGAACIVDAGRGEG